MKVQLSLDVLNDNSHFADLDDLVTLFETGQHVWDVFDIEETENSQWLRDIGRAGQRTRELLRKTVTQSVYDGSKKKLLHSKSLLVGNETGCPPKNASMYLKEPVRIVVENATSDRIFVTAMMSCYGRNSLLDHLEHRHLVFEHCGGIGEIRKRIDELPDFGEQRRILIFVDSDASEPGSISTNSSVVQEFAVENKLSCIVLSKRSIENYLPVDVLPFNNTRKFYLRLTEEQRSHFPMKTGWKDTEFEKLPALYKDENVRNIFSQLRSGFGKTLYERFSQSPLTPLAIEAECPRDPHEIARLLDEMERLI